MRDLSRMTSQSSSTDEEDSLYATKRFIRRPMQKGLLAKALAYTNTAMGADQPILPSQTSDVFHQNFVGRKHEHKPEKVVSKDDIINNNCSIKPVRKLDVTKDSGLSSPPIVVRKLSIKSPNGSDLNFDSDGVKSPTSSVISEEEADQPDIRYLSFHSTQQLRSGFFRSIKRQYSPILPEKELRENQKIPETDSESSDKNSQSNPIFKNGGKFPPQSSTPDNMTSMARRKLEQLRSRGPKNLDVSSGLQWIRLELHEMREQDKTLFLQLIKLHSSIKDLRAATACSSDLDSYDDLHSAASLWWPRRGFSSSILPDFSASDGAQLIRNARGKKSPLRRGHSLNYPNDSGGYNSARHYEIINNSYNRNSLHSTFMRSDSIDSEASHLSLCSGSSSIRSATAC